MREIVTPAAPTAPMAPVSPAPVQAPSPASGARLALALAAALCAAAVLCAAASFVPYASVPDRLDAIASTGSAGRSYPAAAHDRLVLAARIAAVALLGVGGLVYARRVRLARALAASGADVRSAALDLRDALHAPRRAGAGLEYPVLAALMLVGAGLRVMYMQRPPGGDEVMILLQFAQRPWPVILVDHSNVGNHVLHTLLMRASWLLLGDGTWGMRLPDLLTGVALIPATYAVTRGLYGGAVASVTAALVAGSTALIDYSVNGRGYCLQALLLLLLFGIAQLQLRRSARPGGRPGRSRRRWRCGPSRPPPSPWSGSACGTWRACRVGPARGPSSGVSSPPAPRPVC